MHHADIYSLSQFARGDDTIWIYKAPRSEDNKSLCHKHHIERGESAMLKLVALLITLFSLSQTYLLPVQSAVRFHEIDNLQQSQKTKPSLPKSPSRLDQASALILIQELYTVASNAENWTDAAKSARVQARIADFTWTLDPTRATKYLTKAWATAESITETSRQSSRFKSDDSLKVKVKSEVIRIAERRLPELAQKWIEETKESSDDKQQKRESGIFDNRTQRSALLLQSALQNIDKDPQAAAEMAIRSLEDGISFDLRIVLVRIQEKDFKLSQGVFRAALATLRSFGMRDPNELLILYAYLYTPARVSAANTSNTSNTRVIARDRSPVNVEPAAVLDPAMAIEFLTLACDLLLNAPAPSSTGDPQNAARAQISAIQTLLRPVSERLPSQAVLLQARLRQLYGDANFTQSSPTSHDGSPRTATDIRDERIKELEDQAEHESNSVRRDLLYAKAAVTTLADDYQRGLSLATKIGDAELKGKLSNWLIYRAVTNFIRVGDLVLARDLNAKNTDLAQRAACIVLGAQQLIRTKKSVQAKRWLQDASSILLRAEPGDATARVALGIVAAYGRFDHTSALEALIDAVPLINKSPNGVEDDDSAPSSVPFAGSTAPNFSRGTSGFGFTAATSAFQADQLVAVTDVLRTIKVPEVRGTILLALCRQNQNTIIEAVKLNSLY